MFGERKLKLIAAKVKINEKEFLDEYLKNSVNKNWLKNVSKKTNKKWSLFAKKEETIET